MSKKRKGNKKEVNSAFSSQELNALQSLKEELNKEEKQEKQESYIDKFKIKLEPGENKKLTKEEIQQISKTSDLGKYEKLQSTEIITELLKMQVNSVNDMIDKLNKQLCYVELLQVDIYHLIENLNFNAAEGYDLAKALQIVLKRRREIKDDIQAMKKLKEKLLKETIPLVDIHCSFIKNVERLEIGRERPMEEVYEFRVLEKPDIKIRHIRCMIDDLLK